MIGSFICRVLILALGYVYPAYKCYKTVELNKPEIEQLRFWCQYWILVALLSVFGAFADVFFSWLPFYYEAKLGVYLFLWHPQTNGATVVYEKYVRPYISEHEYEIDHTLLEFRARASDNALVAQQLVASYLKTSLSEMVKYALLLMPAQKMDSFQSQQPQQPGQSQEPLPPSVMPPAHQPAAPQQPQGIARTLFDPIESSETQEQPIKEGISLHPSPAQSQERVPETDSLQTAQVPTSTEEPIEVETSSSEAVQNSDQQLEAAPIEEAATHTTQGSLRKRVPIATISPA